MIDLLLGLLGAALGAVFFIAGFTVGRKSVAPPRPVENREERDEETERERLREEQRAFHDLLGYNADVAYGRKVMPGKE